mmetsp:Transcript_5109/g.14707  ORF Transcript_5109/g.14707 Transcript_5109/m.14707 type:complete len:125 (-) Transcript_5109:1416-1790(-)
MIEVPTNIVLVPPQKGILAYPVDWLNSVPSDIRLYEEEGRPRGGEGRPTLNSAIASSMAESAAHTVLMVSSSHSMDVGTFEISGGFLPSSFLSLGHPMGPLAADLACALAATPSAGVSPCPRRW